jgi:hypothetical protein
MANKGLFFSGGRWILAVYLTIFGLNSAFAQSAASVNPPPKGVMILVPGIFSNFGLESLKGKVPDHILAEFVYFSEIWVNTVRQSGYDPIVIRSLGSWSSFEDNGQKLAQEMKSVYLSKYPKADVPITILSHSSGAFYTLAALSGKLNLPVKKVLMVAAPLDGNELVDLYLLGKKFLFGSFFMPFPVLDFEGIRDLSTSNVKKFLSTVKVDDSIQFFSFPGYQPGTLNPLNFWNSSYLIPPLNFTSRFILGESDGLVSLNSTLMKNNSIQSLTGGQIKVQAVTNLRIPLDHFEQFIDHRIYEFLGFKNAYDIGNKQREFAKKLISFEESVSVKQAN